MEAMAEMKPVSTVTVTKLHKSLTSAYKNLYLGVFLYAAYEIGHQFFESRPFVWNLLGNGDLQSDNYRYFTWLVLLLCAAVGLHLLRIYLTMERLEDPTSNRHERYLSEKGWPVQLGEQWIRMAVILIVSLKFMPIVDTLNKLAWFLAILYCALLSWDLFMWLFGGVRLKETYLPSSSVGLCASLLLIGVSANETTVLQRAEMLVGQAEALAAEVGVALPKEDALRVEAEELHEKARSIAGRANAIIVRDRDGDDSFGVLLSLCVLLAALGLAFVLESFRRLRELYTDLARAGRELFRPYYGAKCTHGRCHEY